MATFNSKLRFEIDNKHSDSVSRSDFTQFSANSGLAPE